MKKFLLALTITVVSLSISYAQSCTGDIHLLEDEKLEVWKVAQEGTTIYSLGAFQGTVNIGGTDYTQPADNEGWGVMVMSHEVSGAFNWAQQITGDGFFVTSPTLAVNSTKVLVGVTEGGFGLQSLRFETFAIADGTPAWSKEYPVEVTGSNLPYQAQVMPYDGDATSTEDFIISGAFAGSLDINGTVLTTSGSFSESFVMALDTDGTDLWAVQSTGSNGRGRAWTLNIDGVDDVVIGGHYTGTIDFGGTSFSASDTTQYINGYLAKLNPIDGAAQWVVGLDNNSGMDASSVFDNIYNIDFDGVNNIYFSGNFNFSTSILGNTISSAGATDALVGSLSPAGAYRWANQLGGPSTGAEFATTINYVSSTNALFMGGQFVTDSLFYNSTYLALPPTNGHYVFGVDIDGNITGTAAGAISNEDNFGYSAAYDDVNNILFMANLRQNNGVNVKIAQWIPNRPLPLVHITQENGILDPTETLTAFNDGTSFYQWFLNGSPIGTGTTFSAGSNGTYSLSVTNSNGCSVTSENIILLDGNSLESDSLALVYFYYAMNGDNWTNNTNWLTGTLNTWHGVGLDVARVISLDLSNNNVLGDFPASFGSLTALEYIWLYGNPEMTGRVPNTIWNMTNLTGLTFHDATNLTWEITADIQNLTRLVEIRAWETNLTGTLPAEIGNVLTLQEINVFKGEGHELSGSIPTEIGNLVNLHTLNLGGGNLTGGIPASIGNLTNLTNLQLWDNDLSGPLPNEIGALTGLQFFHADDNQLSGSLPSGLSELMNIIELNLSRNQLTGPLPDFSKLSTARVIELTGNPINAVIPIEWGGMNALEHLNMEACQLQGDIPVEVWQIPTIRQFNFASNPNLNPNFPTTATLETLTQLENVALWNTKPSKITFPEGFYSLTNLNNLDLGGQQLTGTLDSRIGNLINLNSLYLWGNRLEGDFPPEIINATGLRTIDIGGNDFTSFPDLSGLANISQITIRHNKLDFDDIVPNLGVAEFIYAPQKSRGENQNLVVDESGTLDLVNVYNAADNQYQWVRNVTDSIATAQDYSITNAQLPDLGGYYASVTNSAVPDLTLTTPFYNVAFSGAPKSWTVDNSPESLADFKSLYAGIFGTNSGDTLYVAGSATPYNRGNLKLEQQRVIYGPGYFLEENPETQANALEARATSVNIAPGASGSQIYGMTWSQIILNNQASSIDDTLRNVHITGNKINAMGITDDVQNILVDKNFINFFSMASTPLLNVSRSYQDIFIENNIIDTVTSAIVRVNAEKNVMTNVNFNNNTISVFLDSIQDATLSNNIINDYQAVGNNITNTQSYAAAGFINTSGLLSIDKDFQTTDASFNAGAFSGSTPYRLSGLPLAPHIFGLTDIGRIRLNVKAKNDAEDNINFLNYKLGQNGNVVAQGTVRRLVSGNPVEVTFRPKLGAVEPGGTYNLMIWAKDAAGVKSVHHNLSFVAETTTASGTIFTADNAPVTNGEVLLFEINQEGNAFDTLSTTLNNQGGFTFSNIVIGDYLALGKANASAFPGYLPTYYLQTDLWEDADTLLIDTNNPVFDITLLAEPKEVTGNGVVKGFLEEELGEEGNAGGRVMAKGRVGGSGVSMRRDKKTAKSAEDEYELIAYVYTNDNGEFEFKNLPTGSYRINFQYPGYPMDTLSDINIDIQPNTKNNYDVVALVDEGKISVTLVVTTGLLDDVIKSISVYPNPTSAEGITVAFMESTSLKGKVGLTLYDMAGNLLISKSLDGEKLNKERELYLPLPGLNKGSYILKLSQDKKDLGTVRVIVH